MKLRAAIPADIGEHIRYVPDTGEFFWITACPGHLAGRPAGCKRGRDRDYIDITFRGIHYPAARIAFFLMTGEQPTDVDHADCNSGNNRWANLRAASRGTNTFNRRGWAKHGKGAYKNSWNDRFHSTIAVAGRSIFLGSNFRTADEARAAYAVAAHKYHGEFARTE